MRVSAARVQLRVVILSHKLYIEQKIMFSMQPQHCDQSDTYILRMVNPVKASGSLGCRIYQTV